MKFLVLFAALAAVTCGFPAVSEWTLVELSDAIQDPSTDPDYLPYLVHALNQMMSDMMAGEQPGVATVVIPELLVQEETKAVHSFWTLQEISEALQLPTLNPALRPYLEHALNAIMSNMMAGGSQNSILVNMPTALPLTTLVTPVSAHVTPTIAATWTLQEIGDAINSPATNPVLVAYLVDALNTYMDAIYSGIQVESMLIVLPAGIPMTVETDATPVVAAPVVEASAVHSFWTLQEISEALQLPTLNPALRPYLEHALNAIMSNMMAGGSQTSILINMPTALPLTTLVTPVSAHVTPTVAATWTLQEIGDAINSPATNPVLVAYLVDALNTYMDALYSGIQVESMLIVLPAGIPLTAEIAETAEIADTAVATTVEASAAVEPETVAAAAAAPLVQIIININNEEVGSQIIEATPVTATVAAAETTDAVNVVESALAPISAAASVEAVSVVEAAVPANPIDVIAVAAPEVTVDAVSVVEAAVSTNPIDVIAVAAPEVTVDAVSVIESAIPANPIDVIAIAAPEIVNPVSVIESAAPANPIDVIAVAAPEAAVVVTPVVASPTMLVDLE